MSKLVVEEIEDAAGANPYSTTVSAEQATTSGTSIDFTGIPAGVKEIKVMLDGVSTNGSSRRQIVIGDAGGFETSGYVGEIDNGIDDTVDAFSSGFIFELGGGASAVDFGIITLVLANSSDNTWVMGAQIGDTGSQRTFTSGGAKALSGVLTQVRISTENGSDTFDAGAASIQFE